MEEQLYYNIGFSIPKGGSYISFSATYFFQWAQLANIGPS